MLSRLCRVLLRWRSLLVVVACTCLLGVFGDSRAVADTCNPQVTSVSAVAAAQTQTITMDGSCLGTQAPYTAQDSNYFAIHDGSPTSGWGACSTQPYDGTGANLVTCSVSSWTETSITFTGFDGSYGQNNWFLSTGDHLQFLVDNPLDGNGPSTCDVTVGLPGTTTCGAGDSATSALGNAMRCAGLISVISARAR